MEEFGPKLTHIKGEHNIVADTLSRMELTEEEFSADAFASEEREFPDDFPLSYKEIACDQEQDETVQRLLLKDNDRHQKESHRHSDKTYELVTREGKIVRPKEHAEEVSRMEPSTLNASRRFPIGTDTGTTLLLERCE